MTTKGTGNGASNGTGLSTGIESAFAMSDAAMNLWKTLSDDWLALSRAQIETNLQLVRALAECRDPAAAGPLLIDNVHTAVSRYVSAAAKASSTVSQATSAALTEAAAARHAAPAGADRSVG